MHCVSKPFKAQSFHLELIAMPYKNRLNAFFTEKPNLAELRLAFFIGMVCAGIISGYNLKSTWDPSISAAVCRIVIGVIGSFALARLLVLLFATRSSKS
jgi:hypothetical protein